MRPFVASLPTIAIAMAGLVLESCTNPATPGLADVRDPVSVALVETTANNPVSGNTQPVRTIRGDVAILLDPTINIPESVPVDWILTIDPSDAGTASPSFGGMNAVNSNRLTGRYDASFVFNLTPAAGFKGSVALNARIIVPEGPLVGATGSTTLTITI